MISSRALFLITVSFIIAVNSEGQVILNRDNNLRVEGKVKSITITEYNAASKFGKMEQGGINTQILYKFDKKGNEIEYEFNTPGKLYPAGTQEKFISRYNNKGKLIELIRYYPPGKLASKKIYTYDDESNTIEENWYQSDGKLTDKFIFNFNDKGKIIEKSRYVLRKLSSKETYVYDTLNRLITHIEYDNNGEQEGKYTYTYDNKNQNIEELFQYKEKNRRKKTFKYNENGNIIETATYDLRDGSSEKQLKEYDKNGNLVKIDGFEGNINSYRFLKKYNSKGYLLEDIFINIYENSAPGSIQYSNFDINGNWLLKTSPSSIIKRQITYY